MGVSSALELDVKLIYFQNLKENKIIIILCMFWLYVHTYIPYKKIDVICFLQMTNHKFPLWRLQYFRSKINNGCYRIILFYEYEFILIDFSEQIDRFHHFI